MNKKDEAEMKAWAEKAAQTSIEGLNKSFVMYGAFGKGTINEERGKDESAD